MTVPESVLRWRTLAEQARAFSIEPTIVLAMIWQESGGDPWAMRYEPRWRYFVHKISNATLFNRDWTVEQNRTHAFSILGNTEFHCQSISWGLMQVLGSVARQYGHKGYLSQLCQPEKAVWFGLKHLREWGFQDGKNDLKTALTRYNGSEVYAREVMEKMAEVDK